MSALLGVRPPGCTPRWRPLFDRLDLLLGKRSWWRGER